MPLGFGTAQLHGGSSRPHSLRLIAQALDCGIEWFDTAPLYALGTAESVLGEALAGRRHRVTIVSKVGILPVRFTHGYRAQALVRRVARRMPGVRSFVRPMQILHPEFGVFDPSRVRRSVECSLRALRTDYLDVLLLHECTSENAANPALLQLLAKLVREGKIRAYGTATDTKLTRTIASDSSSPFSVYQYSAGIWSDYELPVLPQQSLPVTHSILGPTLKSLLDRLASDNVLRMRASALGIDPDCAELPQRLLAYAISNNRRGVVLFSTQQAKYLNAATGAITLPAEEAYAGFALIRSVRAPAI